MSDVKAFKLVEPKIAYHGGYNVYWTHYDRVLKEGGFLFTSKLEWGNISKKLNNNDFNVFMWAGLKGDWKDLFATKFHILDYLSIRRFVRNGGGYIGSCYGASEISSGRILPINFIKACLPQLPSWPKLAFTTYASTRALPGGSWYGLTVKIKDSDNPIAFGLKSEISKCSYWSGPMFLGLKGKTKVVATIKGIDRAKWDFSNRMPEHPIPQSLLDLWINFSIDKPIWITTEFGNGKVVAFGDHPERMFFYDVGYTEGPPPRILFNAVRYASSIGPTSIDVNVLG